MGQQPAPGTAVVPWLVPAGCGVQTGLFYHGVAPAAQPAVTAGHGGMGAGKIPGKASLGPAEGWQLPGKLQSFPSDTCRAPQAGEK